LIINFINPCRTLVDGFHWYLYFYRPWWRVDKTRHCFCGASQGRIV